MTFRQRYFLVISAGYILVGLIIVVRAVLASVLIAGIFGGVLIALGLFRLRDFRNWRSGPHGS